MLKKSLKIAFIIFLFMLTIFKPEFVLAEIVDNQVADSNKVWTIKFNCDIQFDETVSQAITVIDSKGNNVNIVRKQGEDKRSILVKPPAEGYVNGEYYTLYVGTGIKSATGKPLKGSKNLHFHIADTNSNTPGSKMDPNLEAAIRKQLGKQKGEFTASDAERLYGLTISDTKIKSLEGIQYFKNLYQLELINCDIEDIKPIASLKKLVNLVLSNNKIVDISSLVQLTNLEYIDLDGNPIEDIGALYKIKSLRGLRVLGCVTLEDAEKSLQYISIPDPKLEAAIKENLRIGERKISVCDAEKLTVLGAPHKGIRSLEGLQYFKNLSDIRISENEIRDVSPLKDLKKIHNLEMDYNPVQNIEVLQDLENMTFRGYYFHDDIKKAVAASLKAKEIIAKVIKPGMTDFDKELALHDYVVQNVRYDYENYCNNTVPHDSFTPYGLLINKTGVCEAYSSTMKILFDLANIECIEVRDLALGHSWNIVKIDGEYYHLDATWDDPVTDSNSSSVSHKYFNLTDDMLRIDRYWLDTDRFPKCTAVKYNYQYMQYWKENSMPQGTVCRIKGILSLPQGEVAPEGGISIRLKALTKAFNYAEFNSGVIIPEGKSSANYEMPLIPNKDGYILKYDITQNWKDYEQTGYFSESNPFVVNDFSHYTKQSVENTTDKTINFTLTKGKPTSPIALPDGNEIKGAISLADGKQAKENLGFIVSAEEITTGNTCNISGHPGYIPQNQSSTEYAVIVSKDITKCILHIRVFDSNGVPKDYYYNEKGCVEDKNAATIITPGNCTTVINLTF